MLELLHLGIDERLRGQSLAGQELYVSVRLESRCSEHPDAINAEAVMILPRTGWRIPDRPTDSTSPRSTSDCRMQADEPSIIRMWVNEPTG